MMWTLVTVAIALGVVWVTYEPAPVKLKRARTVKKRRNTANKN